MRSIRQLFHVARVAPVRMRGAIATGRSLRSAERALGPLDSALLALRDQLTSLEHQFSVLQEADTANRRQATIDIESARADEAARSNELAQHALDLTAQVHHAIEVASAGDLATRQALVAAIWLTNAPIADSPLVSVMMPTHLPTRLGHLRHAIESVRAQTYGQWELLVIDNSLDGMLSDLPYWWPDDSRVRILRSAPHQGNRARNEGLAAAKGELIAYLDDDCVWFPWWLRAAVTSLEGAPAAQFAYGVLLCGSAGNMPDWINAVPLTTLQLHVDNPVDTNSLVHRAGLGERWDSTMNSCGDYDLVQRLSVHPHIFVPIPACAYGTKAPDRVWAADTRHQNLGDLQKVRTRARRSRPLRIVAANTLYPLITETYIGDELEGLRRHGVDVVLARQQRGPTECPSVVDAPAFDSLDDAISMMDPDLVLSHWAEAAQWSGPLAAARGVPHAIRLHSFCAAVPDEQIYTEWCVGTWGFALNPRQHPLAQELPTQILQPGDPNDDDALRKRTILSVSAGLPKKAWPTLIEAANEIADARLHVIVGRTAGWVHLAEEVAELSARHGHLNAVDTDVPFALVQKAIRSSATLVYCVAPGAHLGQPRSVIEGALAATPLVVPDEPELRAMVGETAMFYTRGDTASLASAIRRAMDEPHPMDQRLALADNVRAAHADPHRFAQWAEELTRAVVTWQSHRASGGAAAAGRWWTQP